MTEAEWLACTDPKPMLELLRGRGSARKLRLFACACVRRVWHLLADPRSRRAVEAAEAFADGRCSVRELDFARGEAWRAATGEGRAAIAAKDATLDDAWMAAG